MNRLFILRAVSATFMLVCFGCDPETAPSETSGPMAPVEDAGSGPDAQPPAVDAGRPSDQGLTECMPSVEVYEATQKQVIQTHCGQCHGETLQFGAVHTLTSYESLLQQGPSGRPIDLLIDAVASGDMPPRGQETLGTDMRQTLVEWASCGTEGLPTPDPTNPGGDFDSNRPILMDPGAPPSGTDFFEFRAEGFEVSADARDRYECFYFEAPVGEERFIRRIETIQGDSRVLHHATLLPEAQGEPGTHSSCNDDNPLSLVYGWAPGQGALHFEEGGIRVSPGQRFTLQIHYNNAAGHTDVRDTSGVRIYHGPTEGPEVSMLTFGPLGFNLPPNRTTTVDGWCRLPADTKILFSFPHMHETGVGFNQVVEGTDPEAPGESVVRLDGWDFGSQFIYETPVDLSAGDIVRTSCTFTNPTDRRMRFGPNTGDEMCFNFAYVSPPPPISFCNQNDRPIAYEYTAGECAGPGAEEVAAPPVFTAFIEGEAPRLEGGEAPEGLWIIADAKLYLASLAFGGFELDTVQSRVTALGTAAFGDGRFYFDATTEIHAVANGVSFDSAQPLTFNGPVVFSEEDPGALSVTAECGELPTESGIRYGYSDGHLLIVAPSRFGPVSFELLLRLEPAASR
jgi:hypothetical protein